ncbi:MAG: carbohydrate ABC transporter permease [Spirochaetia bacterium]|nr:carbohydrate ABC transporter permease [Spirochaetia bacterium]
MKQKNKGHKSIKLSQIFILAAFIILAFTFLYPLYFMMINSLKTQADYMAGLFNLPEVWNFHNYKIIFTQFQIHLYMKNSLIITFFSVVLQLTVSVFASYAFAKIRFPGSRIAFLVLLVVMFIPGQITMIPLYILFAKLRLINSFLGVVIAYAAGVPSVIMLMTANFRSIPNELIEAVNIDGGGYFYIIKNVIVPLGKPAIGIALIFQIIGVYNNLFIPLILLNKQEMKTVIVALTSLVQTHSGNPPLQMTGLVISSLPLLISYLFFQRYIVQGLTVGSIK